MVVTGAAHGIGREIALAFARRGARVVICDIDGDGLRAVEAEVAAMGRECRREVVDVARAWQVEEFCSSVYKEFGRVDVLVNNAGVACGGRVECMSLDDWRWIIGVNLWGVIHGCHFFYPRMIEQGGGGHIVNISSAAALAPLPDIAAYCATKSGVRGFPRPFGPRRPSTASASRRSAQASRPRISPARCDSSRAPGAPRQRSSRKRSTVSSDG